ncbi:MAG: hypothetical protein ACOYWZ_18930 [Bacillota bacterium]
MSVGYIRIYNEKVDGTIEQQKQHLIYYQEKKGLSEYFFCV